MRNDVFLVQLSFEAATVAAPLRVVGAMGGKRTKFGRRADADREEHPLPCLVLLDLNPFVDGFEVLSWIGTRGAQRDFGNAFSSTLDQDKEHALGAGRRLHCEAGEYGADGGNDAGNKPEVCEGASCGSAKITGSHWPKAVVARQRGSDTSQDRRDGGG